MRVLTSFRNIFSNIFNCICASTLTAILISVPSIGAADGPIILTVTGNVGTPNRGAVDADVDKFFTFNEIEFDHARQFSFDDLMGLDVISVQADFPKDGPIWTYEGPTLFSVLEAAGASGATVTIQALDGYAVEIPYDAVVSKGAVVALRRNGQEFAIGGFGPSHVVFSRSEDASLSDMPDDWWVWSIYHIRVE
jgi:hypothetical protein